MLCPRFLGQCSIHQRGESIDKGSGGVGVGEWKEQELIHGERLWEAKAQGRGEGCRERGLGGAEGAGGREIRERAGVSRKQMRPYGLKSWCEFASRC